MERLEDAEEDKGLAIKQKPSNLKHLAVYCPILSNSRGLTTCLGRRCAIWVALRKDTFNPDVELVYEGCGLVFAIPWQPRKKKEG
jgi:hypothetical protein